MLCFILLTQYWLDSQKPIHRQLSLTLPNLKMYFGVKFYTPEPSKLEDELTRWFQLTTVVISFLFSHIFFNHDLGIYSVYKSKKISQMAYFSVTKTQLLLLPHTLFKLRLETLILKNIVILITYPNSNSFLIKPLPLNGK